MSHAQYDTADVRRVCERKLAIDFREGKHSTGWYLYEGQKVARIVVAHGKKSLRAGTFGSMADGLKLTKEQFELLLACPLDGAGYLAALRAKGEVV